MRLRLFSTIMLTLMCLTHFLPNASAEDPRERALRLRKVNSKILSAPWSSNKLKANLIYRCPLFETLGFIALHHSTENPQNYAAFVERLKPIAEQLATYAEIEVRGGRLPKKTKAELAALREEMFQAVEDFYGLAVRQSLTEHLTDTLNIFRLDLIKGRVDFR